METIEVIEKKENDLLRTITNTITIFLINIVYQEILAKLEL